MGENSERKRGASAFDFWLSLFADDCALFFNSRADLITGSSYLNNHLRKFGLLMHVGNGAVPSKTEAMYFPPPRVEYSAADTSRIDVCDPNGAPVGFIDFTKEFKYLGSIVHYSLSSEADVDKRIKSATAAFGALKNVFTNRHLDLKLKGRIYVALCLGILLYGRRSGVCERICSADFAAFITAACAPCAGSTLLTPFATTFRRAASSLDLVSSL